MSRKLPWTGCCFGADIKGLTDRVLSHCFSFPWRWGRLPQRGLVRCRSTLMSVTLR